MLRRSLILLAAPALVGGASAQLSDSTAALTFSRTWTIPLSRAKVFEAAQLAWQRSFGLEPAARLGAQDAGLGSMEGSARVNFRSTVLTAREETMGSITYRVSVQAGNGECTVRITQLVHHGNRKALKGGMSFGTLTATIIPPGEHPGISHRNTVRIWADIKQQAQARIEQLLNTFGAVLKDAGAP